MSNNYLFNGFKDVRASVACRSLVATLGWQDVRQRYRRSALGPFWLTISMAIMIASIGLIFGKIFKSPVAEFFPFVTLGLILWSFISTVVTDGCMSFVSAEGIIKQLAIPLPVHILRMLWRNIIIFAHNLVIFPIVLLIFHKPLGFDALYGILGFGILMLNLFWMSLLLGIFCTRYRDIPQIVTSLIQVFFYLTPIMWLPSMFSDKAEGVYLLTLNPFYHFIEIVRAPLIGGMPTTLNWMVSCGFAIVGWLLTLCIYGKYRTRIAYWL